MRRVIVITCLLSFAAFAFVACDPEETDKQGTRTPVVTIEATQPSDATPEPTGLISIQTTESPSNAAFARDPISKPSLATTNAPLILAVADTPEVDPSTPSYDRIVFRFDGELPAYEINYVEGPAQDCASGENAQVAGQALLQIRFSPAVAHDEQGTQTVTPTDLQPDLPVIQQAKQTCDFEGVVIWTLGLSAEVDYRAFTLGGQILTVDVKHP